MAVCICSHFSTLIIADEDEVVEEKIKSKLDGLNINIIRRGMLEKKLTAKNKEM